MNNQTNLVYMSEFETMSTFAEKVCEHDIVIARGQNYFIWSKGVLHNISRVLGVCIDLQWTKSHKDALHFFQPLFKHLIARYIEFEIIVSHQDCGAIEQLGKTNPRWKSIRFKFSRESGQTEVQVDFSDFAWENVCIREDFLLEVGNTTPGELLDAIYYDFLSPKISVIISLSKTHDNSTIYDFGIFSRFAYGGPLVDTERLAIHDKIFECGKDRMFYKLSGPSGMLERRIGSLKKRYNDLVVEFKTDFNEVLLSLPRPHPLKEDTVVYKIERKDESKTLVEYRHNEILNLCMTFHFLAPYELLEIIDRIPTISYASRMEKVSKIERVFASMRKVWDQREINKAETT